MNGEWGDSKKQLRARLAAGRSALIWELVGLSEETLSTRVIAEDLTTRDILVGIAQREIQSACQVELALNDGKPGGITVDRTAATATFESGGERGTWDKVMSAFLGARKAYLDVIARATDEQLEESIALPADGRSLHLCTQALLAHDVAAYRQLRRWRKLQHPPFSIGPKSVLAGTLRAARKELLTAIAVIPSHERAAFVTDGRGQTVHRELYTLSRLTIASTDILASMDLYAGSRPAAAPVRRSEAEIGTWEETWADLHGSHETLRRLVAMLPSHRLSVETRITGRTRTLYASLTECAASDRDLAARIRRVGRLNPRSSGT